MIVARVRDMSAAWSDFVGFCRWYLFDGCSSGEWREPFFVKEHIVLLVLFLTSRFMLACDKALLVLRPAQRSRLANLDSVGLTLRKQKLGPLLS